LASSRGGRGGEIVVGGTLLCFLNGEVEGEERGEPSTE